MNDSKDGLLEMIAKIKAMPPAPRVDVAALAGFVSENASAPSGIQAVTLQAAEHCRRQVEEMAEFQRRIEEQNVRMDTTFAQIDGFQAQMAKAAALLPAAFQTIELPSNPWLDAKNKLVRSLPEMMVSVSAVSQIREQILKYAEGLTRDYSVAAFDVRNQMAHWNTLPVYYEVERVDDWQKHSRGIARFMRLLKRNVAHLPQSLRDQVTGAIPAHLIPRSKNGIRAFLRGLVAELLEETLLCRHGRERRTVLAECAHALAWLTERVRQKIERAAVRLLVPVLARITHPTEARGGDGATAPDWLLLGPGFEHRGPPTSGAQIGPSFTSGATLEIAA